MNSLVANFLSNGWRSAVTGILFLASASTEAQQRPIGDLFQGYREQLQQSCRLWAMFNSLSIHSPFPSSRLGSANPMCALSSGFVGLDVAGVTDPFDIHRISLRMDDLRGRKVLSLGEGFTDMVSLLAMRGVDAYGLDIDNEYSSGNPTTFLGFFAFPGRFIHGDATRFSSRPETRGPFDHEFSQILLCDLDYDPVKQVLLESVRTLKVGGTSRHTLNYGEGHIQPESADFNRMLGEFKAAAAAEGIRVSLVAARQTLFVTGDRLPSDENKEIYFLLITRLP